MEGVSAAALLKVIASYGVLGLGWVVWILTMAYLQAERRRYQSLVIHIIQYFTRINAKGGINPVEIFEEDGLRKNKKTHASTFRKLFGTDLE